MGFELYLALYWYCMYVVNILTRRRPIIGKNIMFNLSVPSSEARIGAYVLIATSEVSSIIYHH